MSVGDFRVPVAWRMMCVWAGELLSSVDVHHVIDSGVVIVF